MISQTADAFKASGRRAQNLRLIDGTTLRQLSSRSDVEGFSRLFLHLAVIGICLALVSASRGGWASIPAMLLLGLALVTLFAPVHECIHATAFRTRTLNHIVAWIVALPTLLNADFYRLFHQAHHRHCQDPQRDPELRPPPPTSKAAFLWRICGAPYWRARIFQLKDIALGRFDAFDYIPESERSAVRRSVLGMLAVYAAAAAASAATGSDAALYYWILPVLLARPFLQLYLLSEHTDCSADDDVMRNTRTTLALWPIRLMMWNMPFHTAHHLYPQIPFHALPKAQKLLADSGMVTASGYFATNWTLFRTAR